MLKPYVIFIGSIVVTGDRDSLVISKRFDTSGIPTNQFSRA
ncbi:hypothetical protein EV700_3191 [Fluviicoccus keumensis]|uniref:Uncharacterized protein n=1 Tax=Fluviicoccus keumensis TaxID=1435465 RepID=A0A4Q7YJR5_9GAMM|nr:hypothetical protein EV700_3191 [Fluviicoccus keumensis]